MPLVWVTGISGAGKSTVARALRDLGHAAYDVDEGGFRTWRRRATGQVVEFPGWPAPPGWHDEHHMPINRDRVEALKTDGHDVFLCGTVDNERDVWDLFDVVACLVVDEATLRRRLASRPDEYGKAPSELAAILEWHRTNEATYRRLGASIIDATQPLEAVVEQVIELGRQR